LACNDWIQNSFDGARLKLDGMNVLIAGAQQAGLWHVAMVLGQAGARLMLCDADGAALEQVCGRLQDEGLDARWVAADLNTEQGVAHVVSETLQRIGDIEVLVNPLGAWAVASEPDQASGLRWGLDQVRALSQAVVQQSMAVRHRGWILHLLAPAGQRVGEPAAQALRELTRRQVEDWAAVGIKVQALAAPELDASDRLRAWSSWLACAAESQANCLGLPLESGHPTVGAGSLGQHRKD
jgi:NAD(P)-dependent dehydrogenase (short-subunit alcohol dehydrogenase family)